MSTRTGIAIHRAAIRCVTVRGGKVVWTHTEQLHGAILRDALERALRQIPRSRLRKPRVRIAFGSHLSQQRRLEGLPDTQDRRILSAAVGENSERFFLRPAGRLVVSSPMRAPNGELFGAAFDGSAVAALVSAGGAAGVVPEVIATVAAVLPLALVVPAGIESFTWMACDERIHVRLHEGLMVSAHSIAIPALPSEALADGECTPPLRDQIAEHGEMFAAAFGAAVMRVSAVPALRHEDVRATRSAPRRAIRIMNATALTAAVATWLFAPALAMTHAAERAESYMIVHGVAQRRTARAVNDARRAAAAVARVHAFRAERRSMIRLLGELTTALPESTAVTSVRIDSLGGNLVLLAPHAMAALPSLLRVKALEGVQPAGPVTREQVSGRELERLAIRFRLRITAPREGTRSDSAPSRFASLRAAK